MSVLNASVFGVVAALVVGGADYAMTIKKHVGQDYGLIDHIEFRLGSVMPGSGVAKALPPAPTGWDVRDASIEDSLRMTGQPVDAAKLASMTALNDKIIAAIPGLQTEDRVYQNGEAEVFLDISFVPANMKDSKASRAMAQVFSSVYDQAGQGADVGDGAHLFDQFVQAAENIRRLYAQGGTTMQRLADQNCVGIAAIFDVIHKNTWTDYNATA